jgi:hypothetical protein
VLPVTHSLTVIWCELLFLFTHQLFLPNPSSQPSPDFLSSPHIINRQVAKKHPESDLTQYRKQQKSKSTLIRQQHNCGLLTYLKVLWIRHQTSIRVEQKLGAHAGILQQSKDIRVEQKLGVHAGIPATKERHNG